MSESGTRLGRGVWLTSMSRQWPRLIIGGVIDVLAGIVALVWPGVTVLALAIVLGVLLLMSGAASVSIGVRTRSAGMVGLGVVALIAAVIVLVHPGAGVFAVLLGCAIWFLLMGIADLSAAWSGASGRAWWALLGVLSIGASVIMLADPGVAISTVAIIVGLSFLLRGMGEFSLGLRVRRMGKLAG
jgi:uncharacterized membrane protein HdeD (DUF308 family)